MTDTYLDAGYAEFRNHLTAKQAIERSIGRDEIVEFDASEEDHELLRERCEGCVDVVKQYGYIDYWGGDEELGTDWRVHARVAQTTEEDES